MLRKQNITKQNKTKNKNKQTKTKTNKQQQKKPLSENNATKTNKQTNKKQSKTSKPKQNKTKTEKPLAENSKVKRFPEGNYIQCILFKISHNTNDFKSVFINFMKGTCTHCHIYFRLVTQTQTYSQEHEIQLTKRKLK